MITGILCAIEGEIALLREDMRFYRYARRRAGILPGSLYARDGANAPSPDGRPGGSDGNHCLRRPVYQRAGRRRRRWGYYRQFRNA